jgi:hypothetical protein
MFEENETAAANSGMAGIIPEYIRIHSGKGGDSAWAKALSG